MDYGFGFSPADWAGAQPVDAGGGTVELDGMTFYTASQPGDSFGLTVWPPKGWVGSSARGGPTPYETADGGYRGPVLKDPRKVVLEGNAVASSRGRLMQMVDQLGKSCLDWETMTVSEDALGLTRQMDMCRLQEPSITVVAPRVAVFTLELESAKFEKLGITQQSAILYAGTTATPENVGDYPGQLTANLVGPLTNVYLSWNDANGMARQWSLKQSIASGQTLLVDFPQRKVRDLATAAHYRLNASGDWPVLQPGKTAMRLTTNGGAGYVELFWRSAWA